VSSRVGKTAALYFVTQVGSTIAGFFATWYITNTLGAAPFGEYSTAVALLFWLNIPASTLGIAINKRVSEGKGQDAFIITGNSINFIIHAVLIGGLVFFREQVNIFIGLNVAIPSALLVAARAFFDLTLGSLRGTKRVGTSGILKTAERVLRSSIHIGALFFLSIGVAGLILGHTIALTLATAAGWYVLKPRYARPRRKHVRDILEYAQYAWLGTLKTRAFAWTDVMVMRGLSLSIVGLATVTKSQIGIYKVAWTVAAVLGLISISIRQTLFPELSELGATDDYKRVHHLLNEGLAFSGIFVIPGVFGAIAVGDTVLTIFGPEFAAGGTILVILVISRLFSSYGEQLLNTINAIDRPDIAFRVNLAFVIVNVSLNLILVSLYGWYGAAIATALASLASLTFAGYALIVLIGQPQFPVNEIGRQVAAAVIMLLVIAIIQRAVPRTLLWTILLVVVGATVYGVGLFVLSPRTRKKVNSVLPR